MVNLNWKIGGKAGEGINVSGAMFAKCFLRGGYNAVNLFEYPSLIRGGHNTSHVRVSDEEIYSVNEKIDILVALNEETITLHENELNENAVIIYDNEKIKADKLVKRKGIMLYGIPLEKLANKCGKSIVLNTIALGASFGVVDYDISIFYNLLKETFEKKGKDVVEMNINAAKEGYNYIKKNYKKPFIIKINKTPKNNNVLCTGNEAISVGAINAGMKMYCAYPMTPASSIMHYLAAKARDCKLIMKHTEDEITAMNMAIGANFAGIRAMTGTSGGGFALMTEAIGMAAQSETPIVAVEVQRPGPSTGVPTRTSQGDLRFVMHASQGEFLRVVIAPGDTEECFYETMNAFNLADKYQIPAMIISDKYLGESQFTSPKFDAKKIPIERGRLLTDKGLEKIKEYKRYLLTNDGVSPRSIPGQKNGIHLASSYDHEENSCSTEDEKMLKKQAEKRWEKKLPALLKEIPAPKLYGLKDADITLVGWGSTKGPILEALKLLARDRIKANFIQFTYIIPFREKEITEMLKKAKKLVIVENNYSASLAGVIRENTGIKIDKKILKYTSKQFFPEEIYREVKKLVKKSEVLGAGC